MPPVRLRRGRGHRRRYTQRIRRTGSAWGAALTLISGAAAAESLSKPEESDSGGDATVVVRGAREPTYAAKAQTTGSRATRPVADVPQAMTVVPGVLLEDMGSRRIEDALALTPSVQLGSGFGLLWEDYYVRGSRIWSGTMYRNGYLTGYSGISSTDAIGVERVEVLRGPAAALYGPVLPGGAINVVTKRPLRTAGAAVTVGGGSFGSYRAAVDATGPLSSRVAYRVTGAFDRTEGYRDFDESSRVVVNPSFSVALSSKTRLLLETQVFRVRYRPDSRGVPIVGGDPFALPNSRSLVEPTTPITEFDGGLGRVELEHVVDSSLSVRVGLQRQEAIQDERALAFLGFEPDGRTLDRLPTHYRARSADLAAQVGVEWRTATGPMDHDVVAGLDLRHEAVNWRVGAAAAPFPIDAFEPVYGGVAPPVDEQAGADNVWTYDDAGLYANDVVHVTRAVRVVVGGRVDQYRQKSVAPIATVNEKKGEFAPSGRLGFVWDATDFVSAYASASRGFWPVLGVSADTKLLSPERSTGAELGARLAIDEDRFTLDASVFSTWNRHVTLPDPAAPDFQVQRDLARNRGVELWATAHPIAPIRLVASYTLTDARVTEDSNEALVDTTLPFVSRHAGGAWAMVEAPLAGAMVDAGGGFRAVGTRHLNDGTPVPGYGRIDGTLGIARKWARLRLLIQNLAGARYVQSGNDVNSVLFGSPRSFFLTATASF
ncbi:MAG TPA: TonB-dependent siderophore receptor [Polyangiaceae bacterium]|nr:TonB-dependent siderophore receptor [Polyangiaceae bacterium]